MTISASERTPNGLFVTDVDGRLVTTSQRSSTPLSQGGVDVATTSTLLVAANTSRSVLTLTNGSDTGMWVTLAASGAATGMGIYMAPGAMWSEAYSGAACAMNVGAGTKRMGVVEL